MKKRYKNVNSKCFGLYNLNFNLKINKVTMNFMKIE